MSFWFLIFKYQAILIFYITILTAISIFRKEIEEYLKKQDLIYTYLFYYVVYLLILFLIQTIIWYIWLIAGSFSQVPFMTLVHLRWMYSYTIDWFENASEGVSHFEKEYDNKNDMRFVTIWGIKKYNKDVRNMPTYLVFEVLFTFHIINYICVVLGAFLNVILIFYCSVFFFDFFSFTDMACRAYHNFIESNP